MEHLRLEIFSVNSFAGLKGLRPFPYIFGYASLPLTSIPAFYQMKYAHFIDGITKTFWTDSVKRTVKINPRQTYDPKIKVSCCILMVFWRTGTRCGDSLETYTLPVQP